MSILMDRAPPNTKIMPPSQPPSSAAINSQTFVEKIIVGMDHAPQQFDLRGQLIGAGGANLHYIRNETGAIATLRGRGSMFIDLKLGTESPEPLHLYIEHPRYDGLQSAKQLAKNLIETLQQELVIYHQLHPPTALNGSIYTKSPAMAPPLPQLSIPPTIPTLSTTQMSVPPPMVAHPPPPIIQPHQTSSTLEESHTNHFLTSSTTSIMPNSQIPPPNHANIMQQHLHPSNMIIQQQITPIPTINNVSIPPPNLQIKPKPMLHLQGPPPNQIQLTQPPPNIQLPQTPPANTQIVLSSPQPSYQYQYIQQTSNGNTANPNQITVQHIYQQPIQGLVQPTHAQQPQFNPFAQPGQVPRPAQHIQATSQYFVQGNNAYLVPPPNMVHSGCQAQQNIIFQTQPPPNHIQMQHQIQQVQTVQHTLQMSTNDISNADESQPIKEELTESPGPDASLTPKDSGRNETKTDEAAIGDTHHGSEPDESNSVLSHTHQSSVETAPPLMSVPPPVTCVQHIVGNTLITTTANQSQSHKMLNQIPVSIQQLQAPQQQIHVSTANGQHFLVHAQQWSQPSTQFQPVSQAGNIQGFHLTSAQPITTEMQPNTHQPILAAAFNPHQLQGAPSGMQVQFQQIHSAQSQHLIQQIPAGSVAHLIEQPPPAIQTNQMHIMPPTFSVSGLVPPTPLLDTMVNQPRLCSPYQPKTATYSGSKTNIVDTQLRIGQKRKLDEDAIAAQRTLSRSGIGNHSNAASITTTTQIATTTSSTASHTSSSNVQDDPYQNEVQQKNYDSHPLFKQAPPMQGNATSGGHNFNSSFDGSNYGSDSVSASGIQRPMRYSFDGPMMAGAAPQRYRRDFSYQLRPPPPPPFHMQDTNFPMHRMNFRPPPPPPPPYGPPPSHFPQW